MTRCPPLTFRLSFVFLSVLLSPAVCWAVPIQLQMITDEITEGKAVLLGDLLGANFEGGVLNLTAVRPDGTPTKHWALSLTIIPISFELPQPGYDYNIRNIV